MGWMIFGYVILGVILLVAVYFIATYNAFIRLRNKYEEAFAAIDVFCKKRYDLIPNLIETIKGYAKHEEQTFVKVVEARAKAMQSKTIAESQANETALEGALKSLFALAENYPDLKANQGFLDLQAQLTTIEESLQVPEGTTMQLYSLSIPRHRQSPVPLWHLFANLKNSLTMKLQRKHAKT